MHEHDHDHHPHRTLNVADVPFDAANQSLSDALRASFRVLKAIMIVLVVLFLFSGLKCIQSHEKAVVLRFGKLLTGEGAVREPGLSVAFPFPIDETLRVSATAERIASDSHWLHLTPEEQELPLSRVVRGGRGLHPARDGALLSGDKGLAHVKWSVVYEITDLAAFVATVSDANDETAELLIETLLENAAVEVAAGFTAQEITQTRKDTFTKAVLRSLNEGLEQLGTGIRVTTLETPNATVPVQTRPAFTKVTKAENEKTSRIKKAEQQYNKVLNATAGVAHRKLIGNSDLSKPMLMEELEKARAADDLARVQKLEGDIGLLNLLDAAEEAGDADKAERLEQEIERILVEEATGLAGTMIRAARAEHTATIQGLRGDVEQYVALLPEFQTTPRLLLDRLWQETKSRVLSNPGVNKVYLPQGKKELRLLIHPDPEARREDEVDRYKRESGVGRTRDPMDFEIVPEPIG